LNRKQRTLLADKLCDGGNLAVGALVFGQFLGQNPFSPVVGILGLCSWTALVVWAMSLCRE
jgi:hypothetical protein